MASQLIPGVLVGTRIASVRIPKFGDWIIGERGQVVQVTGSTHYHFVYPILEPDNPYNVIDLKQVPIPAGWELDGASIEEAYQPLKEGRRYIAARGSFAYIAGCSDSGSYRLAIRPIPKPKIRVLVGEWPIREDGIHSTLSSVSPKGAEILSNTVVPTTIWGTKDNFRIEERDAQ